MKTDKLANLSGLGDLAELDRDALRALHAGGVCPDPGVFRGQVDGLILGSQPLGSLRLWRGKFFEPQPDGGTGGWNRIGLGPWELKRYRFRARAGASKFGAREVLLLDHDQPGNPGWVRAFHDELVELRPGLFLATSHQWFKSKLRFRAYFALATAGG